MPLNKHYFYLLILLLNYQFSTSQLQNIDVFDKLYPNTALVCLNSDEKTDIKIKNNKLSIIKHNANELLILKSNLTFKSKRIRTDDFIKVSNVKATIKTFNGKKYKTKKISNIYLKTEHDEYNGVFYDNGLYYIIDYSEVKDGDIVTISYDEEYVEPRFFGSFFAGDYMPVLKSTFTTSYPKNTVEFNSKEFNNQNLKFNKSEIQYKNNVILTYTFDSIKPIVDEEYDPSYRHKASYILMSIKQYKTKDSVVDVCGNLKNLYTWNYSHIKNTDINSDNSLKLLVDSLTNGISNDLVKTQKIYNWVQNNIAYLAYEDGLGGYVPREASLVYNRRFGDCKDMANLIVRLGKMANLPIYHTWIGTNSIQHQFTEFPSPSCANHMIATYVSKTDTIFLDATGKFYPFKTPTSMIQNKEALIGIDEKLFVIAKVPMMDAKINYEKDSISLTIIDENTLKGNGFFEIGGYGKINLINSLDKKSYELKKKYFNSYFEKGNNKFELDTFVIEPYVSDAPLKIKYSFRIKDYITRTNNLTLLNLNFNKDYFDKIVAKNRKYDLFFSYALTNILTVSLMIPDKYKIDFVPQNVSKSNNLVYYNVNYKKNQKEIIFNNTISIFNTYIDSKNFSEWDEIIDSYKKSKSNLVSLTN